MYFLISTNIANGSDKCITFLPSITHTLQIASSLEEAVFSVIHLCSCVLNSFPQKRMCPLRLFITWWALGKEFALITLNHRKIMMTININGIPHTHFSYILSGFLFLIYLAISRFFPLHILDFDASIQPLHSSSLNVPVYSKNSTFEWLNSYYFKPCGSCLFVTTHLIKCWCVWLLYSLPS